MMISEIQQKRIFIKLMRSFVLNLLIMQLYIPQACSIFSKQIHDYGVEYFCGELIHPACNECKIEANLIDFEHYPNSLLASLNLRCLQHQFLTGYPLPTTNHAQSLVPVSSLREKYSLIHIISFRSQNKCKIPFSSGSGKIGIVQNRYQ